MANHILNGYGDAQVPSDLLCRNISKENRWSVWKRREIHFLNVLLYRYPLDFVNNLSRCDKTEYLDTTENIDAILRYVNDVSEKTFIKGENNGFLTSYRGFMVRPFRENYFLAKLKALIFSGIYSYWKKWFRMSTTKGVKLFQFYAKWTKNCGCCTET